MILIDNTVLSNFALVDKLALLKEYCEDNGCITAHVLAEFEQGIQQGIFRDSVIDWAEKLELNPPKETSLFDNLVKRLGAGESSCLAVALHRRYDLLSDDMAVRKIALQEGIRLSGSIGVLLELIRQKKISLQTGNSILQGFIACGYFSPAERLDEFL